MPRPNVIFLFADQRLLQAAGCTAVAAAILVALTPAFGAARVSAWEMPPGGPADPSAREGWEACVQGAAPAGGAAVENRNLVLIARPGSEAALLFTRSDRNPVRVSLSVAAAGGAGKIDRVEVRRLDANEASLGLVTGGAAAEIVLGAGRTFVKIVPGAGSSSVAVGAGARYAVLPDFFADDTIYDARRFKAGELSAPAENFLFHLAEGGRAIVMCVWPGALKDAGKEGVAAETPAAGDEPEPKVDIAFSGEGDARRVEFSRIEFLSRPVYVGIMESGSMWHEVDVSSWNAWKPVPIEWKRPFEARWRGDFIVAEGRRTEDWHTRSQSFPFQGPLKEGQQKWWGQGSEDEPMVYQEALSHIIYPCWFKGGETRLCLYADAKERGKVRKNNEAEKRAEAEAKKKGEEYAPRYQYPPNIYEKVLIYPLDRVEETPVGVYTPVDVMRDTLGQGPCEYVLDVEGVKPRPDGGRRELVDNATCTIWMGHIFPIVSGKIRRLKEGEQLDEKTKTHLIQSLEDIILFVHAVHDRIREYKKWGQDTLEFMEAEIKRDEKLKPLAEKLMPYVISLNKDVGSMKFEGKGTEGWWDGEVRKLVEEVKADNYKNAGSVAGIRGLGNSQDHMVARSRRYVKGLRQEVSLADTGDPDVRAFAAKVRDRCRDILRRKHPKEGL